MSPKESLELIIVDYPKEVVVKRGFGNGCQLRSLSPTFSTRLMKNANSAEILLSLQFRSRCSYWCRFLPVRREEWRRTDSRNFQEWDFEINEENRTFSNFKLKESKPILENTWLQKRSATAFAVLISTNQWTRLFIEKLTQILWIAFGKAEDNRL